MRKIFAVIFTFIARVITVLLAALTVIATILVLLLTSVDHTLLNAAIYKRAFSENRVYEQLPALVLEQLPTIKSWLADPCADQLLSCVIEAVSSELQTCLTQGLGTSALENINGGGQKLTDEETKIVQACLDQLGITSLPESKRSSSNENLLGGVSMEVQICAHQVLGDEIYSAIHNNERPATVAETKVIEMCVEESGSDTTANSAIPKPSSVQKALLKNLTSTQWEALIVYLLPSNDVQMMIEAALDDMRVYFKGEVDTVRMPLTPLKARLTGQAGEELIGLLLKSQPPCTEEQQIQINAGQFGGEEEPLIYCTATGATLRNLSSELQGRLNKAASEIPEDAILIKPLPESNPLSGWLVLDKNPQAVRQKINVGIRLSPLLPLCLLLLVALFGVRSLQGWLRWWGIPIFIAGLITLSIGIAGLGLFDWAWVKYAPPEIPPAIELNLREVGRQLTHVLVHDLAIWIVLESSLITLLALGMLIASSRVNPPPDPSLPPLAPPGTPGGPVLIQPRSKRKKQGR